MNQSVLKKISVLSLGLLYNGALFGMMGNYKNKPLTLPSTFFRMNFEKLPPELKIETIDQCEDPITFGQTNKENHASVQELGMRNIRRYHNKKNDPRFLLSHYVPILVSSYCLRHYPEINPYVDGFGVNMVLDRLGLDEDHTAQLHEKLRAIREIRKKRAWEFSRNGNHYSSSYPNDPLLLASFFGSNNDIKNVLINANFAVFTTGEDDSLLALQFLIYHHYTDNSNDAFEILLSSISSKVLALGDEDFFFNDDVRTIQDRKACLYAELLWTADEAKNKNAFDYLICKDPFQIKNFIARTPVLSNGRLTILDRMIISKISPGNIESLKKAGGKTKQEVLQEEHSHYYQEMCLIS